MGVSLQLTGEIAELAHELRDALPGASAAAKLQGVLARGLRRERDDLALGTKGHALRVLPDGAGFELIARVDHVRDLTRLDQAARWIEEGENDMTYRQDTPTQIHNDQILPSEAAITNAGSMGAADRARQKMMADQAAGAAQPWWTNQGGKKNLPNTDVKKTDASEDEQLKNDGLDPQKPSAEKARQAMVRKQAETYAKPGEFSKG